MGLKKKLKKLGKKVTGEEDFKFEKEKDEKWKRQQKANKRKKTYGKHKKDK